MGRESNRNIQRSRILRLLIDARGGEVPLFAILALGIAQYNARIHELRKLGFRITNRIERAEGQTHSYFRLEPKKPDTLFGDLHRWRDPEER